MTGQTMTIKDISAVSGCSAKTVGKYANRLFPDRKNGRGHVRRYTETESVKIMESIPKQNLVAALPGMSEKGNTSFPERNNYRSDDTLIVNLFNSFQQLIENQQAFVKEVLAEIKRPELPVPNNLRPKHQKVLPLTKSRRAELVQTVRSRANALEMSHQEAWLRLYDEALYTLRTNIRTKAKNRGVQPLDYAEQENLIPQLIALAKEI